MKIQSLDSFLSQVAARNPGQPEFLQAVTEVMDSLWPFIEQHPKPSMQRRDHRGRGSVVIFTRSAYVVADQAKI